MLKPSREPKQAKNTRVDERFSWAISILDIQRQDKVLEIGCGAGLLLEQIALRLDTGRVAAVDKSAAMIKMAAKRNEESVSTGKVRLLNIEFRDSNFKKHEFDMIAAFNVNFFWKDPARELEIVRRILKPGGELYIFYQAPFEITINAAEPIKDNLKKYSFDTIDTIFKKMHPVPAVCVKAQPAT